ncbi:MAG: hypothetical protein AB1898_17460 [Acidobacteriota bacterium]
MPQSAVNLIRRRTAGLLLAGFLLAVGTPVYLASARGLGVYLLHPAIFVAQAAPYLIAAGLWLPCRSAPRALVGQGLAALLLLAAGVLYIPMLTGLVPVGGDMVALGFMVIDAITVLVLLVVTVVAHGLLYLRRGTID